MKEQKRYANEQEILDAIDAAKSKIVELEKRACDLDALKLEAAKNAAKAESEVGMEAPSQFWRDQMDEYKHKAGKLRASINSIQNNKLPELGYKLSQMRTEVMPFMGLDNSVV